LSDGIGRAAWVEAVEAFGVAGLRAWAGLAGVVGMAVSAVNGQGGQGGSRLMLVRPIYPNPAGIGLANWMTGQESLENNFCFIDINYCFIVINLGH
jgi:hypothetical protein